MKILLMVLFTLFLQAECTFEEREVSNDYFAQANQEPLVVRQIELLRASLKSCFSYEVAFYLFKLQAEETTEVQQKIEFYDKALENLSRIENAKEQVIMEQNRINLMLSKLYVPIDKELSDIYAKKIRQELNQEEKSSFKYYGVYLVGILLILWGVLGLFSRK